MSPFPGRLVVRLASVLRWAAVCAALCITTVRAGAQQAARPAATAPAGLLLTGGKVFTADSAHPWVQAIAIRGDRIIAVGTNAEVRRYAQHSTREIVLGGRVVIPGINDAHDHLGDSPIGVDVRTSASPTPDPTTAEVLDSIRTVAARTPPATWIKVTIGPRVLADTTARRASLDRVDAGHPVLLWTWWGHGAVLNTVGLHALGIADSAADPLGGWYERDASNRLTGGMYEYAEWGALRHLYSTGSAHALVAGLRAYADSALRLGVTTTQNMAGYVDPALTVRAFRDAALPIRVRLIRWSIPNDTGRNEAEWDTVSRRVGPRVVVSGRKWVLDATPIEQNALMRRPYPGRPAWYGRLNFPLAPYAPCCAKRSSQAPSNSACTSWATARPRSCSTRWRRSHPTRSGAHAASAGNTAAGSLARRSSGRAGSASSSASRVPRVHRCAIGCRLASPWRTARTCFETRSIT